MGRLRCSTGLAVERYAGSFYRRTTTDLDFAALHSEHAFAVRLRYEEKLTDKQEVFFQFALLYSTCNGERRIRYVMHNSKSLVALDDQSLVEPAGEVWCAVGD